MTDNYLRKYQVVIMDGQSNALDVSDLRCTFEIEKRAIQSVNYADITIYNLNSPTEKAIIKEGQRVIVKAGYENGAFGVIFDGEIFQPLWERENVTDYKLTLHCIDGDSLLHQNFANFSLASGYDYRSVIMTMADKARTKIPMGHVSDNLKSQKAPRGKVVFGDPREVFRMISQDNNAQFFVHNGAMEVMKITDIPQGEALVISPESGLVGTPEQIDYGFTFRSLLNPNVKISNPCMMIKLDSTTIRQQKAIQGQIVSMLDRDMFGIVIGVTYRGDTRGSEWYVDAVCLNRGGKAPLGLVSGQLPEIVRNEMEYSG